MTYAAAVLVLLVVGALFLLAAERTLEWFIAPRSRWVDILLGTYGWDFLPRTVAVMTIRVVGLAALAMGFTLAILAISTLL